MNLRKVFFTVALALAAVPAVAGCSNKVDYVSKCRLDSSLSYSSNHEQLKNSSMAIQLTSLKPNLMVVLLR